MTTPRRAVVYFFWGERHLRAAMTSAVETTANTNLPAIAITDEATRGLVPDDGPFAQVVVTAPSQPNLLAKAEFYQSLPRAYDSFLYLDADATVVQDVSYGFEKADEFGIAATMAPHYSLDHFWGFDRVLTAAGVPGMNQLQYNTGVLFFRRRDDVEAIFEKWRQLSLALGPVHDYYIDQPFFTLAMELLHFNPFTLSPAYNYRAFGELASGPIRIWHCHQPMPATANEFRPSWPLRRFWGSQLSV